LKRARIGGNDRLLAILRDITERKRAEEERRRLEEKVQQAQKLESLGVLAGGIAHDFNNLLTGVLGNAELALMDLVPESPVLARVKDIKGVALRLTGLTNEMLAYAGKATFRIEPLNLSRLVEEMAHLLEVSTSKKAVVEYHLMPDLPLVEADASQLQQVIMNLITNASEAVSDKRGLITLCTGVIKADQKVLSEAFPGQDLSERDYVYMEVSDTGCGMDQETIGKMFDPFFTTKFTGRGLGLAAVQGVVRSHGGAIKVSSELGRGTAVKVLFPCAEQAQWLPSEEEEKEASWRGTGTVLVVDDEEPVRAVLEIMLERIGFSVLTLGSGTEAINVVRERVQEISAVFLDLTMPDMDGVEAFREIRGINPDLPVILASGYTEQDATSRFAGKGPADFIQKPFEAKVLIRKLRKMLKDRKG
jgi:signal transduction histidine kinase/CheY-like chemotaxis protein